MLSGSGARRSGSIAEMGMRSRESGCDGELRGPRRQGQAQLSAAINARAHAGELDGSYGLRKRAT